VVGIGAGLLGFVAGEMAWEDNAIKGFTEGYPGYMKYVIAVIGAAFVLGVGRYMAGKTLRKATAEHIEHLGAHPEPAAKEAATKDPAR
jgi:hypothetical protein